MDIQVDHHPITGCRLRPRGSREVRTNKVQENAKSSSQLCTPANNQSRKVATQTPPYMRKAVHKTDLRISEEGEQGLRSVLGIRMRKSQFLPLADGGKCANTMSSEKQVAQGVRSSSVILKANMENEEFTTVDIDVQFKLPQGKVGFLTKLDYMFRLGIGLTKNSTASNNECVSHHSKEKFN